MIDAFALDTNVTALFAPTVFGLLLAALAHVESPANRISTIIKLLVALEFIRTVCFSLGRCFGFLLWLQCPCRGNLVSTLVD
jgi:hypothetical protein